MSIKSISKNSSILLTGQVACAAIIFIRTGIMARYLSPIDYGLIAAVTSILGVTFFFGDLGLGTAAIQKKNITLTQQNTLFWANSLCGFVVAVLICILAPMITMFAKDDRCYSITVFMSAVFLINGLGVQHLSKLKRDLRFKNIALSDLTATFLSSIIGIILSLKGYKYWSLVWCQVTYSFFLNGVYWLYAKWLPGVGEWNSDTKKMLSFGFDVSVLNVFSRITRNFDQVLITRISGLSSLGIYSRAISLIALVNNQLRLSVFSSAFPLLAKYQGNNDDFNRTYIDFIKLLVLPTSLAGGFFIFHADSLIAIYLGKNWSTVAPYLKILGISCFVLPVVTALDQIPLAKGISRLYMGIGLSRGAIKIITITIGTFLYGAIGCAWGYVLGDVFSILPSYFIASRAAPIDTATIIPSVFLPLTIALASGYFSFILCKVCLFASQHIVICFIESTLLYLIIYLVIYYVCSIKFNRFMINLPGCFNAKYF